MDLRRLLNLIYALLVEGLDKERRKRLDARLLAPTAAEAHAAQLAIHRAREAGAARPKASQVPHWFGGGNDAWTRQSA